MFFVIILRIIIKQLGWSCEMGTIYLGNILCKNLIYSKYTFSVNMILNPFMLITKLEYICNMNCNICKL